MQYRKKTLKGHIGKISDKNPIYMQTKFSPTSPFFQSIKSSLFSFSLILFVFSPFLLLQIYKQYILTVNYFTFFFKTRKQNKFLKKTFVLCNSVAYFFSLIPSPQLLLPVSFLSAVAMCLFIFCVCVFLHSLFSPFSVHLILHRCSI